MSTDAIIDNRSTRLIRAFALRPIDDESKPELSSGAGAFGVGPGNLSAPVKPSARGLTSADAIVIVRAFKRDFHPRGCCPCTHGPSRHGSIRRRCRELAQT
jgi:hypothetical protein